MVNYYKTIDYYQNATGAMPLLYSIRDAVPYFYPITLFIIFVVVFAGNLLLNSNRTGRTKLFIALCSGTFVLVILSMFLFLSQLITYKLLLFWLLACILSFVGLVLSDNQ